MHSAEATKMAMTENFPIELTTSNTLTPMMMTSNDSSHGEDSGNTGDISDGNNGMGGLPSINCHSLTTGPAAHIQTMLPADYVLGDDDVICGRGSRCFNHVGNQRFRDTVDQFLSKYTGTQCKHEKTSIICEVVKLIRQRSPNGGFVKFDKTANVYYEVGDFLAREKVSQAFRDASEAYKSSNSTKKKNRLLDNTNRRGFLHKSRSLESLVVPSKDGDNKNTQQPSTNRSSLVRGGSKRRFLNDNDPRHDSFKFVRGELGHKQDSCKSFDSNDLHDDPPPSFKNNRVVSMESMKNQSIVLDGYLQNQRNQQWQQHGGHVSYNNVFDEEPLDGSNPDLWSARPKKSHDFWSSCPDLSNAKISMYRNHVQEQGSRNASFTLNGQHATKTTTGNMFLDQLNTTKNTNGNMVLDQLNLPPPMAITATTTIDPVLLQDDSLFGDNGLCGDPYGARTRSLVDRIDPPHVSSSLASQQMACGKPNQLLAFMNQRNQQEQQLRPQVQSNVGYGVSPTKVTSYMYPEQSMEESIPLGDDSVMNDVSLFDKLLEFTETSTKTYSSSSDPYQPISVSLEPESRWYEY